MAKMHLFNSASSRSIVVEHLIHNLMIKGSNLPLAKGERKNAKMILINSASSSSIVVENRIHNPMMTSSNYATGTRRKEMAKSFSSILPAVVEKWWNTYFIIL
jgi:hypothetical protein